MRYVVSRYTREQRELAYRIYITDALRMITENTMNYAGGVYLPERYIDMIRNKKPLDTRSGEQIILDTIKGAGLKVVDEN